MERIYPIGAEIIGKRGVSFRVWAPRHNGMEVIVDGQGYKMEREENGYFSQLVGEAHEGSLYNFKSPHFSKPLPDPASRFQPGGPEGPSCVIKPQFEWTDQAWPGVTIENQIIYEMHIGTFTIAGAIEEAMRYLPYLADLGVTLIEIMPIIEFPGKFNWGYEGVNLFAPSHYYGKPMDFKRFIDAAHHLNLGVILDVVYNHFGPEHNYISEFTEDYFDDRYTTDWGKAINFDRQQVREFFLTNAKYWIEEFHFDGLRIDSTPAMFCTAKQHILTELSDAVKNIKCARKIIIIGENEPQNTDLLKSKEKGGSNFDALWNDDFHHSAYVRLTGKREAYYTDYLGTTQEFISLYKYGYLYQGQYYEWHLEPRGIANLFLNPASLIIYLENHDQIANSLQGKRLSHFVDSANLRALTAILLFAPQTPMLFQGQEFNATQGFYFFSDHEKELNTLIYAGRKKFLYQFPAISDADRQTIIPDPSEDKTFKLSKLDHTQKDLKVLNLYRDLIFIRKNDPVFKNISKIKVDGEVINENAWVIRYFSPEKKDRLLIVNLGTETNLKPNPHPLMSNYQNMEWRLLWSSEAVEYGGQGTAYTQNPWHIPGHCALLLELIFKKGHEL